MAEEVMTYEQMCSYCDSQRESDGFCSVSTACSGPSLSNLACDYPHNPDVKIYRGGNYGGCKFVVAAD